jgi:hypothetical protein
MPGNFSGKSKTSCNLSIARGYCPLSEGGRVPARGVVFTPFVLHPSGTSRTLSRSTPLGAPKWGKLRFESFLSDWICGFAYNNWSK